MTSRCQIPTVGVVMRRTAATAHRALWQLVLVLAATAAPVAAQQAVGEAAPRAAARPAHDSLMLHVLRHPKAKPTAGTAAGQRRGAAGLRGDTVVARYRETPLPASRQRPKP